MSLSVTNLITKSALSLLALAAVTMSSNVAQAACREETLPGGGTRTVCNNTNNQSTVINGPQSSTQSNTNSTNISSSLTPVVSQIYQDVLGRTPDAGGLAYWSDQMRKGMPASEVRKHIAHSQESQNNLHNAYTSILGRVPDQAGFQFWINGLATNASLASVRQQFSHSPEGTALINSLYVQLLGRNADPGGMAYWQNAAATHGINAVRNAIMSSQEYASKH